MPAITIADLSPKTLAALQRRAAAKNRTVEQEAKIVMDEALADEADRLPMYVPSEEVSLVFNLPYSSVGVPVQPTPGGKLWPDRPIADEDLR